MCKSLACNSKHSHLNLTGVVPELSLTFQATYNITCSVDGYLCPVISRTLRTKYHKLSAIRTGNYHHSFYSSGD